MYSYNLIVSGREYVLVTNDLVPSKVNYHVARGSCKLTKIPTNFSYKLCLSSTMFSCCLTLLHPFTNRQDNDGDAT